MPCIAVMRNLSPFRAAYVLFGTNLDISVWHFFGGCGFKVSLWPSKNDSGPVLISSGSEWLATGFPK